VFSAFGDVRFVASRVDALCAPARRAARERARRCRHPGRAGEARYAPARIRSDAIDVARARRRLAI
jgi:hypothetical protein